MSVRALLVVLCTTHCLSSDDFHTSSSELDDTSSETETYPAGHLEPLGAHRPAEGHIDIVEGFVEPEIFYEEYVKPSKPVVFKNAALGIPAFSSWSDDYLRDTYGSLMVDVEEGKKENRSQNLLQLSLNEFLSVYETQQLYMVQDVFPEMLGELSLPKCLQCGGFQNLLELGVIWFSSGGTKSVLHADGVDNINCLFDGEKSLIMIDKVFQSEVEADGYVKHMAYSQADVDKVDLVKFPHLQKIPWWSAKMERGDCLFIPIGWYHTVDSSHSRNLAVNLWFTHLLWFNQSDCDRMKRPASEYDTLANYEIAGHKGSVEKIRSDAFGPFVGLPSIALADMVKAWGDYTDESIIHSVFDDINLNNDDSISWEEVMHADILSLVLHYPRVLLDIPAEAVKDLQEEIAFNEMEGDSHYDAHDEL